MSAAVMDSGSTADLEITATRSFDAPPGLVWKAWTDAEHISQWWGPRGFTTTTFEMDVRPGGVWRFVMHGPDGRDYQNRIVYVEVVEAERIVYDHVSGPLFRSFVTFTPKGQGTEVSVRMLFETAALRNRVAEEYGAVEGLQQTLARLAERLEKPSAAALTLERELDAPRRLVFEAWTDPKHLARWWGPHRFTNPVCEAEARPGGAIRIDMRGPDGSVFPMTGTFREVVPHDRLVLETSALDGELQVLTTVTFADAGGKTLLRLRAEVVKASPAAAGALAGMEAGWTQSLERLEGLVRSDDRAVVIIRVFDAPRELVFDAWTEPRHLTRWFAPRELTSPVVRVDLRVGGAFLFCMRTADGTDIWGRGVYREVVRPERLVYTDSLSDAQGNLVEPSHYGIGSAHPLETLVTLTFDELPDGKTKMTLRHEVPASVPERPATQQGWNEMFDRLEETVLGG